MAAGWWQRQPSYGPSRYNYYEDEWEDESEEPSDYEERTGTNWCSCGVCEEMSAPSERLCCHEHLYMLENIMKYNVACITLHPGFQTVVLDPFVLETAYYGYRQTHYRRGKLTLSELSDYKMYRYTACRQLVRWCWGILGYNNYIDLPACALAKIRNCFPKNYSF